MLLGTSDDPVLMQERRRKWSFQEAQEAQRGGQGDGSRVMGEHLEWREAAWKRDVNASSPALRRRDAAARDAPC